MLTARRWSHFIADGRVQVKKNISGYVPAFGHLA
jgi:hypothetical protein